MVKVKQEIYISQELLLHAKNELDMSLDEFIEYSLTMFMQHEDKYAKLFYEGAKLYSDLKKIQDKMCKIENKSSQDDAPSYEKAMETITRIYGSVGHIGKDKLRKIAQDNNISPNELIKYVSSLGTFEITNYTDVPK